MLVATIAAGSGATLSPALLEDLAASVKAARAAWLDDGIAADIFCESLAPQELSAALKRRIGDRPFDTIVQPEAARRKKLLVADMESTIIEQEMLDELAKEIGCGEKVAAITRRAMNGEIDFAGALKERVALLKGRPAALLERVAARITLMPGAAALIATMKANGARCRLVSGGFTCFAAPVAAKLGFDAFFANELIVQGGMIAGEVVEPVLDKNSKRDLLGKACAEYGLAVSDALAVGDGANDVPMLAACNEGGGLGVAYRAKPNVRAAIPNQINYGSLTTLLYAQGYERDRFR